MRLCRRLAPALAKTSPRTYWCFSREAPSNARNSATLIRGRSGGCEMISV